MSHFRNIEKSDASNRENTKSFIKENIAFANLLAT